ncbi:MAG: transcription termination factor NusA [Candidatus Vogelbacteria bacterium RIFOXYD1_FULL_44_32]|uniref:Transcription termination/antitermination protein NusA n=1 Tax=Candidatus Vogelbacteria bacterium RIFOXYD1_FULL_44_32 TaxID=1802438 RepID=A0A1G2QEJ2_9BACT|nr:MAG: transcription termination factor NusA [Candidatus Vogelbacteria bacterium RIFOXYD1_FULL_44_32]
MIDLKALNAALGELEEERNIPRAKIMEAISDALVAAYKKDYGKKGQIIKANFDLNTGTAEFYQVKIAVDETTVRPAVDDEEEVVVVTPPAVAGEDTPEERPRFNEEHHIWLADAKKIKRDVVLGEELVFPLEAKDDYGRIAAQTAKQVIIQRIREAEKVSILDEYEGKEGEIINGKVQKIERGNVFVDLGRTTAILPFEEQIQGEFYRQGERIRAYLYLVEDTPRGIALKLSRSHPKFVEGLFSLEAPEVASGAVEIKAVAREAGSRTKIAVTSHDHSIDPVGSMVGQRGSRVNTVIAELGGEKLDIIEWSDNPATFIANALSPAKVNNVTPNDETHQALVDVPADQFSLAVGKGGQNVRLAAKLTSWKIDITTPENLALPEEDKTEISPVITDEAKEEKIDTPATPEA